MKITLQLDAQRKRTLQELFLTSAQVPSLGLSNTTLIEDSAAVFRVAKEFSADRPIDESRSVEVEDVVRTLRFICWLLSYDSDVVKKAELERTQQLKQFFATIVLQAQSQYSGFEVLLHRFGVDRQLENQMSEPRERRTQRNSQRGATARMTLGQTNRTKQVHIRVDHRGAEMVSTTTESIWTVDGWKESKN